MRSLTPTLGRIFSCILEEFGDIGFDEAMFKAPRMIRVEVRGSSVPDMEGAREPTV